jgi:N6-adenosine-specific RNA methylase IME4
VSDVVKQNAVLSSKHFRFEQCALVVDGEPTFDEWKAMEDQFTKAGSGLQWWIGDWLGYGERVYGEKFPLGDIAAYKTQQTCKTVAGRIEIPRRRGNLSFAHHAEVAKLELDEQDRWLDAAEENGWTRAQMRRQMGLANEGTEIPDIKPGEYQCIVIDPPWPIERIQAEDRTQHEKVFEYPTMSLDAISETEIGNLAHEECHLYLWTTQKFLPASFDILEGWGFRYIFCMTWHKPGGFQPFGLPQYNSEFVLFGRRGSLGFEDTKAFPTCFDAPRREHSRKPDEFYDLVRRVSLGPRVDVFSREKREGFDQWGDEVDKFIRATP